MSPQRFSLDEFSPKVKDWFLLIHQARSGYEGTVVPSFLEITQRIRSDLDLLLKENFNHRSLKSVFLGITVISYLNEKYAIEKVMLFAKGRCRTSIPSPSDQIAVLHEAFSTSLNSSSLNAQMKTIGKTMLSILKKDFQAARETCTSLAQTFNEKFDNQNLSVLESVLFSLCKADLIFKILKTLNIYQIEFAKDPFSLYFSILKNLLSEIQSFQNQKKSSLQALLTFFNNISQLEKK